LIIVPKFVFEVPYFRQYLWTIRPVISSGLLLYASAHPDFGIDVEDKQRQYSGQQSLFPDYFDPARVDTGLRQIEQLTWAPRMGPSATRTIEQAWQRDLNADEKGELTKIAVELADGEASVLRILDQLERVPKSLDGRAFILENVLATLPLKFTGEQLTRLNLLINGAYLRLYLQALNTRVFVDTPIGALDCGLRNEPDLNDTFVSFSALRGYAEALGIRRSIERLSWSDLVELREDLLFRWCVRPFVASAAGDDLVKREIERALRESGVYAMINRDLVFKLDELRDYLKRLWEKVDVGVDAATRLAQFDYTQASTQWLKRRVSDRLRQVEQRGKDPQKTLPLVVQFQDKDSHGRREMKAHFAILTIREDEFRAVLRRFPESEHYLRQRFYEIARVARKDGAATTVVAILRSLEQGSGAALDATRDIIDDVDPDVIVVAGIGGGLPSAEYTLGDVVVATSVQDLRVHALIQGQGVEFAAVGNRVRKSISRLLAHLPAFDRELATWSNSASLGCLRPLLVPSSVSDADVYGSAEWIASVRASIERHFAASTKRDHPRVISGSVASSDALIKDADRAETTREFIRQVMAFEMEAAGVFQAASRAEKEYPVLVVRGISDIIGLKRDPQWTQYACDTAASFVHELITSGLLSTSLDS